MTRERSNAPCPDCAREGCDACHHSGERPAVPTATFHGPVFDPVPPGHLSWVDAYAKVCEERDEALVEVDETYAMVNQLRYGIVKLTAERDALRAKLDAYDASYERERDECDRRYDEIERLTATLAAVADALGCEVRKVVERAQRLRDKCKHCNAGVDLC